MPEHEADFIGVWEAQASSGTNISDGNAWSHLRDQTDSSGSPSRTRISGWADYLKIRHGKVQERPRISAEKKVTLHVQRLPRNGVTMWRPLETQASSAEIPVQSRSHCWSLLPFSLLGDSGNLPLPITSISPGHTTPDLCNVKLGSILCHEHLVRNAYHTILWCPRSPNKVNCLT